MRFVRRMCFIVQTIQVIHIRVSLKSHQIKTKKNQRIVFLLIINEKTEIVHGTKTETKKKTDLIIYKLIS